MRENHNPMSRAKLSALLLLGENRKKFYFIYTAAVVLLALCITLIFYGSGKSFV